MKNLYLILVLCLGSIKAHASAGNAKDGLMFSLTIIGMLLILSGILFLLDFFKGNGMQIIRRIIFQAGYIMIRFFKKIRLFLRYPVKVLQS